MKSSSGRTAWLTARRRAAQMPTGTPMATAMTVATRTTASVSIVSIQRPIAWISRNARSAKTASPILRATSASPTNTAVTTRACGAVSTYRTAFSSRSMTSEMKLNSGPKCSVSQSTPLLTGVPRSSLRTMSGIPALLLGRERGQQGGARDDAEQSPVGVGDGERHAVAADEGADVAQRRLGRDLPVLLGRDLVERRP